MRFQTGAVKHGRNTDSQVASIGGTRCGSDPAAAKGRFGFIPVVESSRTALARVATSTDNAAYRPCMTDPIIQRIESFHCLRGRLLAERRSRGYTLYRASSGAPVARLRPIGRADRVEVLYWSLWSETWKKVGPFGRTVLPLEEALQFIVSEDIFWAIR
jgi:hypothetical protein